MEKVLIVEDEFPINQVLAAYLKKYYEISQAYDGNEAIYLFKNLKPSIVLLDIMLPEKDGWHLLKEFRNIYFCPIIIISALGNVSDRLKGFEYGADDYISKPFYGEEVLARVNAVLKRTYFSDKQNSVYRYFGSLKINLDSAKVYIKNREVVLPPRELSLLLWFAGNPNKIFTRDQLLDAVWGIDYEGSDRAVDLSIKRLRKFLHDWPMEEGNIQTVRGLGYQMSIHD